LGGKNYWLLGTGITIFLIGSLHAFAADDDKWYVGKGAKENMHLKYEIEHLESNNGQPFNMTISLVDFNSTGKYWIAPVSLESQGRILNGTFHLHESGLEPLLDSDIPSDMAAYTDTYKLTLDWLSGFTAKEQPLSLDARSWGRIGSLGGQEIRNLDEERITVPAGAFDTTVMGINYDIKHLKIWINKDLPYPVKEDFVQRPDNSSSWSTYARFELLEVGGAGYVPVNVEADNAVTAEVWSPVWKGSSFPLIVGIGAAIAGIIAFITLRRRRH
jgi:hypothetical protein